MPSIHLLEQFVSDHAVIAYLLIVVGMVLEGEMVVILAGVFAHLGGLNVPLVFASAYVGGMLKSTFGYVCGWYIQKKHSKRKLMQRIECRITSFFPSFREKPFWAVFSSRFLIFGLNWLTLVFSGYMRINIRTFYRAESMSLVPWIALMMSLGYFFSYTALSISRDIKNFILIVIALSIGFYIIQKIVSFIADLSRDSYTCQK